MSQAGAKDLATTLDETDFKNTTSADVLKGNVLADASVVQKVGYTQQHPLDTSSSAASAANLTLATGVLRCDMCFHPRMLLMGYIIWFL